MFYHPALTEMLVRARFTDSDGGNVIQVWSLFVVPDNVTLLEAFGVCLMLLFSDDTCI